MKWYESKSNQTVVVTAVVNIAGIVLGYPIPEWVNIALLSLWGIFMRQGVTKSGPTQ